MWLGEVLPFTGKGYQDLVTTAERAVQLGCSTDTEPCIVLYCTENLASWHSSRKRFPFKKLWAELHLVWKCECDTNTRGLPLWSSKVRTLQGAQVWSLVREARSHMLCGQRKKKKEINTKVKSEWGGESNRVQENLKSICFSFFF